jgi:Tol biopolymer transport system component
MTVCEMCRNEQEGLRRAVSRRGRDCCDSRSRSNQRNPGVYVANRDGSAMRRVTPRRMEAAIEPAWSPDAAWIAFVGRGDLYVIRPDGTGLRRLTRTKADEFSPAWQPRMPTG